MIVTTTDTPPGRETRDSLGVVAGEAILGVNIFRDLFAGITDIQSFGQTTYVTMRWPVIGRDVCSRQAALF